MLTDKQKKMLSALFIMDTIHGSFVDIFNSHLREIEHDDMKRARVFLAFKLTIDQRLRGTQAGLRDAVTPIFEQYWNIISTYITTGGNPQEIMDKAAEWMKQLRIKMTKTDEIPERFVDYKNEIKTMWDVVNMEAHINRIKMIILDDTITDNTRSNFLKVAANLFIDGNFPIEMVSDVCGTIKPLTERGNTADKNVICDTLDEIVEKYTPDFLVIRKNTLFEDLAKGRVKIVVTDDGAEDQLNWDNI